MSNTNKKNKNSNLGYYVSDARKKKGLSQEALADKANVSLSTIQRIEKGTVKPRAYTLRIIAETLELDITQLISNETNKANSKSFIPESKRINTVALILVFIPFMNAIIPFVFWKTDKRIHPKNSVVGKIVSFQLLWSIVMIIGMGLTLFLSNLIIGNAGDGLFYLLIFYLVAVLYNVFMIVKTANQLNTRDKNILGFVPNFFNTSSEF
ncbi:helix-turn-helix domain-containing protein [Tenacibaculum sp.]|nr:helix-turn-helix domain-containing protein [Tenacibaculum sp.]